MATNYGTLPIVSDGLTFTIDAANKRSYPGSGTTWFDVVGSNNPTVAGAPTFSTDNFGIFAFDGTDDQFSVEIQLLFPDPENFTVEYFINIFASNGNQLNGAFSNSKRLYHGIYNGYWDIGYGGTAWNTSNNTGKQALQDGWNHVTMTATGGTAKIYINGVANTRTITDTTGFSYTSGDPYLIGAWGNPTRNNTYCAVNKLSYLRVYNRGLTAAEVTQNYNALKDRFQ
jgi:hypothetical protein